jgi:hypothetical protein
MELVRVRIKTGNKVRLKNMGRTHAEASDNVEILEGEPTHKGDGSLLPITFESGRPLKPLTTVSAEAEKKATSRSASTTEKENDR